MIKLFNSFRYALSGILFCVKYERNMRIHITVTLYVLYFSKFYEFTRGEWIMIFVTCVLVIVLEMINTSIEVVIDKIFPDYHTLAKIAKDVAAGAVLIATLAAALIGVMLFWDTVIFGEILKYFTGRTSNILLLAASFAVSYVFINSVKGRKTRGLKNPDNSKKVKSDE